MDTGNKIVILVDETSDKMFPFENSLRCLLPIGNSSTLELLLNNIRKYSNEEVLIVSIDNAGVRKLANKYSCLLINKQEAYFNQLYEIVKDCHSVCVLQAECYISEIDVIHLLDNMHNGVNSLLVEEYDNNLRSIDTIGCNVVDNKIRAVYGHPRAHYVNYTSIGCASLNNDVIRLMPYVDKGFSNVNCGQMPDDHYHLEQLVESAIEDNKEFNAVCTNNAVKLEFVWQIAYINKLFTDNLEYIEEDIDKSAKVSNSIISGKIHVGKNSIISDGVIIEGNCWIGDNVKIEKGAIIGKNVWINNGSKVQYGCKINDNTVIGTNNKIGFNAEISGVTFDGVCAVHTCEVYGIIGKKVDIAANVVMAILRFDDNYITQNINGKKYSNPYTSYICIGDYCRTGVNNVFLPGVRIGNRTCLGPSLMIEKDVEANTLMLKKQEVITTKWGSNKYGW